MVISMIATLLKRLGVVCFVFVILWHATHDSTIGRGKAIVHVAQPDHTVVTIDHADFVVQSREQTPVVCDLVEGSHFIQVWRRGVLRGERRIEIKAGQDVVVQALDRPDTHSDHVDATSGRGPSRTASSLAVRLHGAQTSVIPN